MVSATDPASNATAVPINEKIDAGFTEALDAATVTTGTFTLKQGLPADIGISVSGTVSYTGTTATFAPAVTLLPNTVYTATVTTGVKDLAGNALAGNYVWSFTPGAAPDPPPPMVTSTIPSNGATGFPINDKIDATFTEALDAATVNTSSFTLKQGATPVSGT